MAFKKILLSTVLNLPVEMSLNVQELNLEEIGEDPEGSHEASTPPAGPGSNSGWFTGRRSGNANSSRFLQPLVEVSYPPLHFWHGKHACNQPPATSFFSVG